MMDTVRYYLDQCLGINRNGDFSSSSAQQQKQPDVDDPSICSLFLEGCCLSSHIDAHCQYEHNDAVRAKYRHSKEVTNAQRLAIKRRAQRLVQQFLHRRDEKVREVQNEADGILPTNEAVNSALQRTQELIEERDAAVRSAAALISESLGTISQYQVSSALQSGTPVPDSLSGILRLIDEAEEAVVGVYEIQQRLRLGDPMSEQLVNECSALAHKMPCSVCGRAMGKRDTTLQVAEHIVGRQHQAYATAERMQRRLTNEITGLEALLVQHTVEPEPTSPASVDPNTVQQMAVTGAGASELAPLPNWDSLPPPLCVNLPRLYVEPVPVQHWCVPALLAKRDVLVHAPTGAGKTLAYAIPCSVTALNSAPPPGGLVAHPQVLVLTPTRELADQCADTFRRLMDGATPAPVVRVQYGDAAGLTEAGSISVLIAAPGRLADLLSMGHVALDQCQLLVLDEADRYVDKSGLAGQLSVILAYMPGLAEWREAMRVALAQRTLEPPAARTENNSPPGFTITGVPETILERIVLPDNQGTNPADSSDSEDDPFTKRAPRVREPRPTIAMFSATQPQALRELAVSLLHNPLTIQPPSGAVGELPATVKHELVLSPNDDRRREALITELQQFLRGKLIGADTGVDGDQVMVFATRQADADRLGTEINARLGGGTAVVFHGGEERRAALVSFISGMRRILVCTDLAGRGIDSARVGLVLSLDPPPDLAAYVHRVGRTGRAGRRGRAVTYLDPSNPLATSAQGLGALVTTL